MRKNSLLFALFIVAYGCACAQDFDLTSQRVAIASLDGRWRFHTGDNPAWVDPKFDDSAWPLLRSSEGWSSQGYKDYSGIAWYRFQVTAPAAMGHLSLYLPHIRTSYELYADGALVGTFGKMPPNKMPFGGGGDQMFSLPAGSHGLAAGTSGRTVEIAIRVWQCPMWATYTSGGPESGGGLVGDSRLIDQHYSLYRESLRWSVTSYEMVGLMQALAGIGALLLFAYRRSEKEYLWSGLMMLVNAFDAWVQYSYQLYAWDTAIQNTLHRLLLSLSDLGFMAFLAVLLRPRPTMLSKLAVAGVAAQPFVLAAVFVPGLGVSATLSNTIGGVLLVPYIVWIVAVVIARAREGSIDARLLIAPVLMEAGESVLLKTFWVTYTLGWQRRFGLHVALTQQPFPIELPELTSALFLLAVFGILILRFTRTRSQEERFAGEVQAARNVQQYLIPEHLPATPGLAIESEYRPAREVGGDFFQVLPNADDESVLIVVGDVAGHGLDAGMLATLIVGAIRTAAQFTTDPARILGLLNERMNGRGLATCMALRIDRNGNAELANAGHLPPYLNGQQMETEGSLPLGAIAGAEFPRMQFRLEEGDTLMLISDGIVEARDTQGHLFGFERIAQVLREGAPAAALAQAAQDFGQDDDITVLNIARVPVAVTA